MQKKNNVFIPVNITNKDTIQDTLNLKEGLSVRKLKKEKEFILNTILRKSNSPEKSDINKVKRLVF